MSSSAIVFKLGQQTGNIYLLTSGLVNSDKKVHKMTPNGWHLSISRILNGFPWLENTILHFLRRKRYLFRTFENITSNCQGFSRFWEHYFQLQKRYLSVPFMRSLETEKKVPLLRFKTSFGKVRNGWRADIIDAIISFTHLPCPLLFQLQCLSFRIKVENRQKRYQFCILSCGKWMQKLSFSVGFN